MPRIVECAAANCGNEIEIAIPALKRATQKGWQVYCSRECSGRSQPSHYKTKYYCDSCRKWIFKTDAITKTSKKGVEYVACPNKDCNGNKLKTKPNNSKAVRKIFGHEEKRID